MARGGSPMTELEARRAYWSACEHWQAVKDDYYSDFNQLRDAAKAVSLSKQAWERATARRYSGEGPWYERLKIARREIAKQIDDAGMPHGLSRKGR